MDMSMHVYGNLGHIYDHAKSPATYRHQTEAHNIRWNEWARRIIFQSNGNIPIPAFYIPALLRQYRGVIGPYCS